MNEEKTQIADGVASELNAELGFEDKRYVVVGNFAELDSSNAAHHKQTLPHSQQPQSSQIK